jgi:1-acyl-sn-glycerol-3-phosphate acyltransferase
MTCLVNPLGWTMATKPLTHINKCIIIQAPHTSNWDAILGLIAAKKTGLFIKFIIKDTWDRPFIGPLLRSLGAIFVDRRQPNGLTQQLIDYLNSVKTGHIIFTPEGTRSKVKEWKTGFYYIAQQAGIPIALGYIDYQTKTIGIHSCNHPSGNIHKDIPPIRDFYRTITPKYLDQYDPNWTVPS